MSRLTNKHTYVVLARTIGKTYTSNCMQKLSQLEDIEEEIGVDLRIKDKVEQSLYVYYKEEDKVIGRYKIARFERKGICTYTNVYLPYKEYGKTWSVTKEELK